MDNKSWVCRYTGNSCLDTPMVIGYRRVPEPPAKNDSFHICCFACSKVNKYVLFELSVVGELVVGGARPGRKWL